MKIVPGNVVTVKTTDEPCFVLSIEQKEPTGGGLSGVFATVRRPILTQEGVKYVTDTFHVEELETTEARKSRKISDMQDLQGVLGLPSVDTPSN